MTAPSDTEAFLDLIEKDESGGRNVKNFRFDATHTASGYWQITNTTWKRYAPGVGVDIQQYPTADSAPKSTQRDVARAIYESEGAAPWANYNKQLAADLGGGFFGGGGGVSRGTGMRSLPADFGSLPGALRASLGTNQRARSEGIPQIKPLPVPPVEVAASRAPQTPAAPRVSMAQAGAPSVGAAYRAALSKILASGRQV